MESGLLAYLVARHGDDAETVVTEALAYLLEHSAAARDGLLGVCTIATRSAPSFTAVRRRSDDAAGAGAGLLGLDEHGATRLVLLPKLWAGLPARQPVDDLRLFSPEQSGVVVVIAPAERFTTLWAELRRRCRLGGRPVHGDHAVGDPVRWTPAGPGALLLLASWSAVLAGLRASMETAGEAVLVHELDQLASLCERLQAEAFVPLTADDVAVGTPRQLGQLLDLVDEVATACERRGLGQLARRDASASRGAYCRRLRVGDVNLVITWSVTPWATLRETPFWLQIVSGNSAAQATVEARLKPLADELPPRLLRDPAGGQSLVPLFPVLGAEHATVVADLVRQVDEVVRLLGEAPTVGFGSSDRPAR